MSNIIQKLLVNKSNNLLIQFIRYTFVGGLAFLVDFGLLFLLTEYAGLRYLLSATVAFAVGLLVNYFISTYWVFGESSYNKETEFILFACIGIIGLGLNAFFIWFFTEKCHIFYLVSKLISTVLVYLWNFLGRRFLIFNKQKSEE